MARATSQGAAKPGRMGKRKAKLGMSILKKKAVPKTLDETVTRRRSTREHREVEHYAGEDFTLHNTKKRPHKKETKEASGKKTKGTKDKLKKGLKRPLEKKTKAPKVSKKGNDRLVPRPSVTVKREDPALGNVDYVSAGVLYRQLMAAVAKKDVKKVAKLYADEHFRKDGACKSYSHMDDRNALYMALTSGDKKLAEAVVKGFDGSARYADLGEPNLLKKKSSGTANFYMLGRATRAIESSRGGKEGNNAFLNYEPETTGVWDTNGVVERLIRANTPYATLDAWTGAGGILNGGQLSNHVIEAVRGGHYVLAGHLAQAVSHFFNTLQLESLKKNSKFPDQILAVSVRKKAYMHRNITPAHTAAINPDPSLLARLRSVDPLINVPDQNGWYTMHYAAVCESDGPLKYLLSCEIGVMDTTKRGELPLHVAARTGRVKNVKVILEAIAKLENAQKDRADEDEGEDGDEDEPRPKKAKKAPGAKSLVNAKTRKGRTALHEACWNNQIEVVRELLKHPAIDKECPNSVNDKKLTPLMIAAGRGFFELCEVLIGAGCLIEAKDKLRRSPLIIAAMNGQSHIVQMLLQKGADVNRKDSSGNTAMHFACAYGWLNIAKILAGVDASTLEAQNDWLITPLSVAYLKGHYGIVTWLLESEHASRMDINSKDNDGVTLISSLISCHDASSTAGLPEQIDYLISHGVDCSIVDTAGNTPLHFLAAVPIVLRVESPARPIKDNDQRITSKQYKQCIDQLIKAGADGTASNAEGNTPFKVALESANLYMASILFDMYGKKLLEGEAKVQSGKKNLLHTLFALPFSLAKHNAMWAYSDGPVGGQYNLVPLLKKIVTVAGLEKVTDWLESVDESGRTPVLAFADSFKRDRLSSGPEVAKFAATMVAILKLTLTLRPEGVLDRQKGKEGEEIDESKQPSLIRIALEMGSVDGGRTNGLLQLLLSSAVESGYVRRLLSTRLHHSDEHSPVTPLLFAMLRRHETDAIAMLGASGGLEEEVSGACIEKRRVKRNGEEQASPPPIPASTSIFGQPASLRQLQPFRLGSNTVRFGVKAAEKPEKTGTNVETREEPWGKTAFHIAIDLCLLQVLDHLKLSPAAAAKADADGNTAWHYAAAHLQPSTLPLFERLERDHVAITANKTGRSPLHVAVNAERSGSADAYLDTVEWLLTRCRLEAKDEKGRTALHYAFAKDGASADIEKKDPIAVVSLLINAMDKNTIRAKDAAGDTALHLAARADANICTVSLLAKGAEVDAKNVDGNTPLAVALHEKSLASSLTLIQAHAEISGPVRGPAPKDVEIDKWRFLADPIPVQTRFVSSIPDVVVRNEWHSLVYVLLDKLGKTPDTIAKLVAAALKNGQHNFALYLLKLLGGNSPDTLRKAALNHNFLGHFVDSLCGSLHGSSLFVLQRLLGIGVEFIDSKGASPIVEKAAARGHYDVLQLLKDHNPARFATLTSSAPGHSPIRALVERFLSSESNIVAWTQWLGDFAKLKGLRIDDPIAFPRRALPGVRKAKQPEEQVMITPLEAAIQAHNGPLIIALIKAGADVNVGHNVPLLEAVATNDVYVITALVDVDAPPVPNGFQANGTTTVKKMTVRLLNGLSVQKALQDPAESDDDQSYHGEEDEEEASGEDDEDGDEDGGEHEDDDGTPSIKAKKAEDSERKVIHLTGRYSNLDLFAVDRNGRNVCHYLVEPCGWQNTALLRALDGVSGGKLAKLLTTEDRSRESPISLAAKANQWTMYREMVKMSGKPTKEQPRGVILTIPPKTTKDVGADAEHYVNECELPKAKAVPVKKNPRQPNNKSGYQSTGEIMECEETKQLFKVLLNITDMRGGVYGFHNFYRMELIKRKDADLFVLFTNWGRIGDGEGQYQCTPFTHKAAAIKEFRSVFKQKTGQEWLPLDTYEEKPGKYRLTKTEEGADSAADLTIEPFAINKDEERDDVVRFVHDIANVRALRNYAKQVRVSGRVFSTPLGRIAKADLARAKEILAKLRENLAKVDKVRNDRKGTDLQELFKLKDEQFELTSAFYTVLPLSGYTPTDITVISGHRELADAEGVVCALSDMEIAGRLVAAAAYAQTRRAEDPIRYIMSGVECPISLADPGSELVQRMIQWQRASSENIRAVYHITPRRPTEAFVKHAKSSSLMYLFHGTRAENLLSILHYGLKTAPSNAVQCGEAYGRGVYFSDAFEKSRGYCSCSAKGVNYMIISKVAVGVRNEKDDLSAKDKFDTRVVKGSLVPDPDGDMVVDGAVMPLGKLVKAPKRNSWWGDSYSEYIVKDETRILPCLIVAF